MHRLLCKFSPPSTVLCLSSFHSYFLWLYGKPPDIVVEIVSNRESGELDHKLGSYARMGVPYYISK
jgi:Uma2 family endonuclease